jgi:hypothetical protein
MQRLLRTHLPSIPLTLVHVLRLRCVWAGVDCSRLLIITQSRGAAEKTGRFATGTTDRLDTTFASWSRRVIEHFKARLGKFVVKENCFQIPVDWEIDRELVKDLAWARLRELD